MRTAAYDRFGPPEVITVRDLPAPTAGKGQVLVKVDVVSLNPVDDKLREGMARLIRRPRLPAITGLDFAGTIAALGDGVTGFTVGQAVYGSADPLRGQGACAELVALAIHLVAPIPSGIRPEDAACLPIAAGTALQALVDHAGLSRGQHVLITGASGAVGAAAVQIARDLGATITGVCGTANVDYVNGLGADRVVDYKTTDWRTLGTTYDVILDAAHASTVSAARPHLSKTGWYIHSQPRAPEFLAVPWVRLTSRQHVVPFMLRKDQGLLPRLSDLAIRGVLTPRIARTIGLDGVAEAQREMAAGKVAGKILVRV